MKLKEYFNSQKGIKFSQLEKMNVYEQFLQKSERVSFSKKMSFYWKIWVYFTFIMFLILSFYFPVVYYNNKNNTPKITKIGTWYLIWEFSSSDPNLARADWVWEIIEAQGEIKILKDWQEVDTNLIHDWDEILLVNDAQLKFQVNSWAMASIQWPAKFSINQMLTESWNNNYIINLVYWEYFEIKKDQTQEDNLIIKTQDFEVEPEYVNNKLDIKIVSQWDKKILENRWWDVVVKKVVNNKKTFSSVKTNQKVEIDEEVKLLQEVNQITQQIKTWEIETTYELTWEETQDTVDINTVVWDLRQVLENEEMDEFKKLVYPKFLATDLENFVVSYLHWDKSRYEVSYNNLFSRIEKIYSLFGFALDSEVLKYKTQIDETSIDDIYMVVDQLVAKIDKSYYVPPQYTKRIKAVLAWLVILKDTQFWIFAEQNIAFDDIFDKLWLSSHKDDLVIK